MNAPTIRYYVNNWFIDLPSGAIIHQTSGEQKRLGEYQLKLLDVLARNAGEVLSREFLTTQVWEKRIIGNNSLPNAVHALRLALEDDGKNQRLIKTIPKKGYLLEKEFCLIEGEEEPAAELPSLASSLLASSAIERIVDPAIEVDPPVAEVAQAEPEPIVQSHAISKHLNGSANSQLPLKKKRTSNKHNILYALFAVCILAIVAVAYIYSLTTLPGNLVVRKQETENFNNISLFHIQRASQSTANTDIDQLGTRLEDALMRIDKLLEPRYAKLSIYYRTSDNILNYTFMLETACETNELSMNIHYWRLNNERLNTLIYNETERKLNEMVSCES